MHDGDQKTFQLMTSSIPSEIPRAIDYPSINEISVVNVSADFAKLFVFLLWLQILYKNFGFKILHKQIKKSCAFDCYSCLNIVKCTIQIFEPCNEMIFMNCRHSY